MKLNFALCGSIALLVSSADCWKDKGELKGELDKYANISFKDLDASANEVRKGTILALKYPQSYIDIKHTPLSIDEKMAKEIKQFTVYRLDAILSKEELIALKNISELSSELTCKLDEKVKVNETMLRHILERIPIIKELSSMADSASVDDTDIKQILKSHVEQFISDSLIFDPASQTFSALHKAVEALLSVHEVERKARAAIKAIISNLDEAKMLKVEEIKFRIKEAPPKDSSDSKTPRVDPPINLFKIAIIAANQSTSDALYLGYTLIVACVISAALLAIKAFASEEEKETEENNEDLE